MTNYEKLTAENEHLYIVEEDMESYDGLTVGNTVIINKNLTTTQKFCTLSEKAEHYYLSSSDITDQDKTLNRKQECLARKRSALKLCPLEALIKAYEKGCSTLFDVAEFLELTEEVVKQSLQEHSKLYPDGINFNNCMVTFFPRFSIFKLL